VKPSSRVLEDLCCWPDVRPQHIDRFLRESQGLPLSYSQTGIVKANTVREDHDEATVVIGHGKAAFERARAALIAWKQFDISWVETFPRHAPRSGWNGRGGCHSGCSKSIERSDAQIDRDA
jgi:uncharacterized protein DUF1990